MKKNFLYLFTVLCTLSFFTACSDDDDPKDPTVLDVNAAYSGDKLDLKYSDSALLGKEITFDTKDGKTATITMKGTFDISGLAGLINAKSTAQPSMAPGIIPGEVTTILSDVPLILSGEKYTFEGTDSNNERELKYSGEVQKDKLIMSVNVTMTKNDLQGTTWKLAETNMATGSMPFLFTWKSTTGIMLPDATEPWPTNDMAALVNMMMISPKLSGVLSDVTFKEDGNIIATYSKAGATPSWQVSPINLAQYYIKDKKMYVVLNIDMIIAAATKADNKAQLIESIMKLIPDLLPLLSSGIPLNYHIDASNAQVYVDKDLILPILTKVMSDKYLMEYISGMIPDDLKPLVSPILGQLPGILETTTEMNVGLNLTKK